MPGDANRRVRIQDPTFKQPLQLAAMTRRRATFAAAAAAALLVATHHAPTASALRMTAPKLQTPPQAGSAAAGAPMIARRALLGRAAASVAAAAVAVPREVLAAGQLAVPEVLVTFRGKEVKVAEQLGAKATLVVNVASYCALTPQYKDLVQLWDLYHDKGLQILAFPCNQFGQQEPETDIDVIRSDMKKRYNVQFPIFDKMDVNGATTHPLYVAMKSYEPELSGYGPRINWNFEKFLLDASGTPVRRYRPGVLVTDPTIIDDVDALTRKGKLGPRKRASSVNDF